MNVARLASAAILLLALAFGAGCARHSEPLRIGYCLWPGYEYLHLAAALNYYANADVEVRLIEFATVGDVRLAYERGHLDGVTCTNAEIVLAAPRTPHPLQIVAVTDYSDGADVLLARPEITDIAGLRGRRVGVEPGTMAVQMVARALDESGLGLEDVVLAPGDHPALLRDFDAGKLDALPSYRPFCTQRLRDGAAHALFDSSRMPGEILGVIAFGADVVRTRSSDIERVIDAFFRAQNYHAKEPARALTIMAARMRLSPEELRSFINDDLHILQAADQRRYLADGAIAPLLSDVSHLFARLSLIERPINPALFYTARFIPEETSP